MKPNWSHPQTTPLEGLKPLNIIKPHATDHFLNTSKVHRINSWNM